MNSYYQHYGNSPPSVFYQPNPVSVNHIRSQSPQESEGIFYTKKDEKIKDKRSIQSMKITVKDKPK